MPAYPTLESLPQAPALDSWIAFNDRLTTPIEMQWLGGRVLRHDITALRPEDSPLLVTVKFADDWQRTAVGKNTPYNAYFDIALRLYLYDEGGTVEQIEHRYDLIENANAMMVKILRSEYMACLNPYWQQLEIGSNMVRGGRTSVIGKVKERLYITTRIRLLRHFRPGH